MTTSSGSSSGSNASSVLCTTPAGTMIQTARGFSSFATKSSRLPAPTAPSVASASTAAALTS